MATPNRPGRPAIEPQRTGLLLAAIPAFLSSSSPLTIAGEARSRQARPLHRARRLRMLAAMMILCVTPNVAIDRTLSVSGFAAGGVWRAQGAGAAAGGKGLNVARALLGLGQSMCCAGPLGSRTGRQVAALADAEGLPARWTWIGGETRTSVIVVGDGGETTVINEPGPLLSEHEWVRFIVDVADSASEAAAVCISGSVPPGSPTGGLARLIAAAGGARGRPVWLDTSGAALA